MLPLEDILNLEFFGSICAQSTALFLFNTILTSYNVQHTMEYMPNKTANPIPFAYSNYNNGILILHANMLNL